VSDIRILTSADALVLPLGPAGVLVDKPKGMSSFGVVKKIRWATGETRVGHAGTLDPMATGLLVVLVGREATREQDRFMGLPKVYTATMRLGQTTPSADAETPVDATRDASGVTDADLAALLPQFTGDITQTPPIYAAIKVGGERLYKKARRGETVDVPSRVVTVSELAFTARRGDDVDLRMLCSKGTYVRALARDIGEALGVGAHLVALRREAIGPFQAAEAFALDAFDALRTARDAEVREAASDAEARDAEARDAAPSAA
jgi:tRNA pseudouridine55 synthase